MLAQVVYKLLSKLPSFYLPLDYMIFFVVFYYYVHCTVNALSNSLVKFTTSCKVSQQEQEQEQEQ